MLGSPAKLVGVVATSIREWPVRAQRGARRNAMIAATAATARRAERDDVAAYLREHDGDDHGDHPGDHHEPPAAASGRPGR